MHTFTNLQAFADWAIRLALTVIAVAGTVDRLTKRIFKRYFDESITEFKTRLSEIEQQIKAHTHKGKWF